MNYMNAECCTSTCHMSLAVGPLLGLWHVDTLLTLLFFSDRIGMSMVSDHVECRLCNTRTMLCDYVICNVTCNCNYM